MTIPTDNRFNEQNLYPSYNGAMSAGKSLFDILQETKADIGTSSDKLEAYIAKYTKLVSGSQDAEGKFKDAALAEQRCTAEREADAHIMEDQLREKRLLTHEKAAYEQSISDYRQRTKFKARMAYLTSLMTSVSIAEKVKDVKEKRKLDLS